MGRFSTISCLVAISLCGSAATAQVRSQGPAPRNDRLQVPPTTLPGPLPGLGGVPSAAPRPIPINQPPAQPQFKPMPVGPWPGVVIAPPANAPAPGSTGHPHFDGRGGFSGGGTGAVISSGSGLVVNGTYEGDRLRLALHLGSDAFTSHHHHHGGYVSPGWWVDPYYGNGYFGSGYGYYGSWYGNRYGNIYGFYTEPDPAMTYTPAPAPAPVTEAIVPSTNRELGAAYLQAGDPRAAIKAFQAHLKQYPGDEEAMRSLGLALIDAGQVTEGVAMFAMAYKAEPLLCDQPFSADAFRYGQDGLARNLSRVSIYANRVKTPSGWLTLAVFMQAQGRDDLAKVMIERARASGLESVIADRMLAALR